jgi:replicative superfamily II helicase
LALSLAESMANWIILRISSDAAGLSLRSEGIKKAQKTKCWTLQERVQHGVMPELVDLARIKGVKGYRARLLFNNGLRTVQDLAEADPSKLEAILEKGESVRV